MSIPGILVLAGTDGAGKSSIAGTVLESRGGIYYNPGAVARRFVDEGLSIDEANSRAWHRGLLYLDRAIQERRHYALETTLGGRTITQRLIQAAKAGLVVRVWYAGLSSPRLHVGRAKASRQQIPESLIRTRWTSSRENLVRLLPHLYELTLFDNSRDSAMNANHPPAPFHILHMVGRTMVHLAAPAQIPSWCKPIVAAAVQISSRSL